MVLRNRLMVLAFLFGHLAIGCSEVMDYAEFGEECNVLRKCNRQSFLRCNSTGVCECSRPQSMLFEPKMDGRKCLVKAGEVCLVQLADYESGQTTEKLQCVSNSSCSTDGDCTCNLGLFGNVDGICVPFKTYLEECDQLNPCNSAFGLECARNGTCTCATNARFRPDLGCSGLLGEACVSGNCFDKRSKCVNGKCSCSEEAYLANGECVAKKGLNETCATDVECGQDEFTKTKLACKAGICDCESSTSVMGTVLQFSYTERSMVNPKLICAPIPGQHCFHGYCSVTAKCEKAYDSTRTIGYSNDFDYGQYGYYDPDDLSSSSWSRGQRRYTTTTFRTFTSVATCGCPGSKRFSSESKTCVIPYQGTCSLGGEQCAKGLACKRGGCRCQFVDQKYDGGKEKCVSAIRGPCKTDDDCVSDSECTGIYEDMPGECSCKTGFVESIGRLCIRGAGMACAEDADCDPLAGLECTNGKCACRNRSEYREVERRCRGYVGSPCKENDDCLEGVECITKHEKLSGICQCGMTYEKTVNLTCQ